MKKWQEQTLKLGIPILLNWIKSLFSPEKRAIEKAIAGMKKEADKYLLLKDYKKYNEIAITIEKLRGNK